MIYLLLLLVFQEPKPVIVEEPIVDPAPLLAEAKVAFMAGDFHRAAEVLIPAAKQGDGASMLLSADAYYGLRTKRALKRAKHLYERCIYEDDEIPFKDHSYYQVGQILLLEAELARDSGDMNAVKGSQDEAFFYFKQLLKKHPDSYYRDQTMITLLELALESRKYRRIRERVEDLWNWSIDPEILTRIEPIAFIHQEPFNEDLATLTATFDRHEAFIRQMPELLHAYAAQFEASNDLQKAGELYLLIYNLWPNRSDGANSLFRLASLNERAGQYASAAFLYQQIMGDYPDSEDASLVAVQVARLMERGLVTNFTVDKQAMTYLDLINIIRLSQLETSIRAEFSYKLALYESAFGNLEQALLIMRNLLDEYAKGPFVGLYRDFYEKLLFKTIDTRFDQGKYWDLDRLYQQHRTLLAFTPETKYAMKIAKAYLLLDLPSSAMQVYENLWNYKESISGFDLAFEEVLTESLHLYNHMREEDILERRLADYESIYGKGRFYDQYLFIKTLYESRTLEPEEFLKASRTHSLDPKSIYDVKRLRRVAVIAQEEEDIGYADTLYAAVKKWAPLKQQLVELWREAQLYQADRTFELGNYHRADILFREVYRDQGYSHKDRDWAYLQIARLHELKGELKPSLRIYGQIAYTAGENSKPYAMYAERRLASIAADKSLLKVKERLRGQF